MGVNIEKLRSINYWLRYYQLFNCDEAWLLNHIEEIVKSPEWECMKEHSDDGLLHERQLAYLINEHKHIPKLYDEEK